MMNVDVVADRSADQGEHNEEMDASQSETKTKKRYSINGTVISGLETDLNIHSVASEPVANDKSHDVPADNHFDNALNGTHETSEVDRPETEKPDRPETEKPRNQDMVSLVNETETNPDAIVDELLAFVTYRMDTMPHETIKKLCMDFYAEERITLAKKTLYPYFSSLVPDCGRYKARRGPNRKLTELQDILEMLHICDPGKLPDFVAKDLGQLPPLNISDFDICSLLKDFDRMKQDIRSLKSIHNVGKEMSEEIRQLKESLDKDRVKEDIAQPVRVLVESSACQTDISEIPRHAESVNEQRSSDVPTSHTMHQSRESRVIVEPERDLGQHGCPHRRDQMEEPSEECAMVNLSRNVTDTQVMTGTIVDRNGYRHSQVQNTYHYVPGSDRANQASDGPRHHYHQRERPTAGVPTTGLYTSGPHRGNPQQRCGPSTNTNQHSGSANGRVTDQRRMIHGTRKNAWIRTSNDMNEKNFDISVESHSTKPKCVGVFVTRLHENTTPDILAAYVRHVTGGLNVKPEPVKTRHSGYNSFLIRGNQHVREHLLNPNMWPVRCLIKGYFEKSA